VNAQSLATDVGDEPLMIFQKCNVPVVVGAQRVAAARQLLNQFPAVNVLVCDDGLQHIALQRDIEICVMDATGLGNGHLLPAGPLREPWPRQVDLLLHTHQRTLPEGFESLRELSSFALTSDGQQVPIKSRRSCIGHCQTRSLFGHVGARAISNSPFNGSARSRSFSDMATVSS